MEPVEQPARGESNSRGNSGVYVLAAVLAAVVLLGAAYLFRERQQGEELAATNQILKANLIQLQSQIQDLSQRIVESKSGPAGRVAPGPVITATSQPTKARAAKARVAATSLSLASQLLQGVGNHSVIDKTTNNRSAPPPRSSTARSARSP